MTLKELYLIAKTDRYTLDKHSNCKEGDVRRWKDGKLHVKQAHGWAVLPEGSEYDVIQNRSEEKKTKNTPVPVRPATQKEFDNFIDEMFKDPKISKPKSIQLPSLKRKLMKQIGIDSNTTFLFNNRYHHIGPERKEKENQLLSKEEYKQIPEVIKNAKYAILMKGTGNFKILFPDKQNPKKYNKLIFSKVRNGNYLISLGKVNKHNIYSESTEKIVGEGVPPSI